LSAATLTVSAGTVALSTGMINATKVRSLAVNGALDITDDSLVLDYTGGSPMSTISSLIATGFASGAWTGAGITSSSAQAAAGGADKTSIAYAEATDLFSTFPAAFEGLSVDNTSLLLLYTLSGDATLDESVNSADFNLLATNFGLSNQRWSQGDFTYNGSVDSADFNVLAGNFGKTLATAPGASVPEPGLAGALCSSLALFGAERRRRSR
jgi:hypothetical protein